MPIRALHSDIKNQRNQIGTNVLLENVTRQSILDSVSLMMKAINTDRENLKRPEREKDDD